MIEGCFFSCLLKKIYSALTILESLSTEQHPTSVCRQRQNLWERGTAKQPVENKLDQLSNQSEAESCYSFD